MPVAGVVEERVTVPEAVEVRVEGDHLVVASKTHTLRRTLSHPRVRIAREGDEVRIWSELATKREKALVGAFAAHVRNMIVGVTQGFRYEMRIVYSHFPMKAAPKGEDFIIENFLGEKYPRKARILGGTKVEVSGDQVILTGPDVEAVSQTAANIERATRIRGFDSRVFQDGIYITKKAAEA